MGIEEAERSAIEHLEAASDDGSDVPRVKNWKSGRVEKWKGENGKIWCMGQKRSMRYHICFFTPLDSDRGFFPPPLRQGARTRLHASHCCTLEYSYLMLQEWRQCIAQVKHPGTKRSTMDVSKSYQTSIQNQARVIHQDCLCKVFRAE